jgi:hypothetical protein
VCEPEQILCAWRTTVGVWTFLTLWSFDVIIRQQLCLYIDTCGPHVFLPLREREAVVLFSFLLAYICCAKGFHYGVSIHTYNVLQSNPSHPLFPLFGTNSTGFIVLFSYICMEFFDHVHTITSTFTLPPPTYTQVWTVTVLHSCHPFLRIRFCIRDRILDIWLSRS